MSLEQAITDQASERFPSLKDIPRTERRRLLINLIAWSHDEIDSGQRDEEAIIEAVLDRARNQEHALSPFVLIIIGELVAWIVRRILDRLFPKDK